MEGSKRLMDRVSQIIRQVINSLDGNNSADKRKELKSPRRQVDILRIPNRTIQERRDRNKSRRLAILRLNRPLAQRQTHLKAAKEADKGQRQILIGIEVSHEATNKRHDILLKERHLLTRLGGQSRDRPQMRR